MIINVEHVSKSYYVKNKGLKGLWEPKMCKMALEDINFSIKEGEIVGYIGLNGAGKSTTIKILTGVIAPSSGYICVNGMDPFKERIRNAKNIGVMFGQRSQLIWDLPVYRSFDLIMTMYNVDKKNEKEYLEELFQLLNIQELLDIPVRLLSLGQRMRCEFCAVLLHKPRIIYLDEPTIGMDVLVKCTFVQIIKKINSELNTTIVLTSHDLNEIEEICQRIIIIDKGTKIFDGKIDELKRLFPSRKKVILTFNEINDLTKVVNYKFEQCRIERIQENKCYFNITDSNECIMRFLNEINSIFIVNNVEIIDSKLEDIIKMIYLGSS